MILAKGSLNYDHIFTVLATVITIVNYDHKTFTVQATALLIYFLLKPLNKSASQGMFLPGQVSQT
jgi:hypothetical protein